VLLAQGEGARHQLDQVDLGTGRWQFPRRWGRRAGMCLAAIEDSLMWSLGRVAAMRPRQPLRQSRSAGRASDARIGAARAAQAAQVA
jgi:hypothetical protein